MNSNFLIFLFINLSCNKKVLGHHIHSQWFQTNSIERLRLIEDFVLCSVKHASVFVWLWLFWSILSYVHISGVSSSL